MTFDTQRENNVHITHVLQYFNQSEKNVTLINEGYFEKQ